jgi:hypothetical protein
VNRIIVPSIVVLACAAGICMTGAGCASSAASRASREDAQRLNQDDLDNAVAQLVEDLFSQSEFTEWRARELAKPATDAGTKREIVLMLLDFKVNSSDPAMTNNSISGYATRGLFTTLRREVRKYGMTFQRDMDAKGNNRNDRMARFDEQDNDPNFDQGTGEVTTGAAEKVYVGLELEIQRTRVPMVSGGDEYQYTLYGALVDGKRKKDIVDGRANLRKFSR